MSENDEDVSLWMQQMSDGSTDAAGRIWAVYFDKLVKYADRKLGSLPRRDADEEDIALSAMHSLHRGVQEGRFPQFSDREDLWKILLTITSRKAKKRIRHLNALKRGGGDVRGESVFLRADEQTAGINNIAGFELTPEFAELIDSGCEELLDQLDDDGLQRIAILKLQGFTNEEIAEELGCAVRSVERKLNRIRSIWAVEDE